MKKSSYGLILSLKIYNTAINAIAFEKSEARFGIIRISK